MGGKKTIFFSVFAMFCIVIFFYFNGNFAKYGDTKRPQVSLSGNGTEPFWGFTLKNSKLILKEPSDSGPMNETIFQDVRINGDTKTLYIIGTGLEAKVSEGICSDGMSDIEYTHTVQLGIIGKNYQGCANFDET